MSAFAYVKQYCSRIGFCNFPEVFHEHQRRAARYPGFVSLRRLLPLDDAPADEIVTLLEFSNADLMLKWRGSDDHAWVKSQYEKWWTKPPEMLLYMTEDERVTAQ
jgi:heme-degrading monooxygenase HmoA